MATKGWNKPEDSPEDACEEGVEPDNPLGEADEEAESVGVGVEPNKASQLSKEKTEDMVGMVTRETASKVHERLQGDDTQSTK